MRQRMMAFLAMLLIAALVISACANEGGSGGGGGNAAAGEGNDGGASAVSDDGPVTPPGTFPIVKENITLRVMAPQIPEVIDFATNEFTKWYEEKTNIHIEWEVVPSANVKEKLNLVLASGDYPDVFLGLGVDDVMEAQYGVDQGVFRPLDDLIDTYMVEFKNVLEKHPSLKGRMTATDGKIYSLPSINDCFHCSYQQKFWINKVWLDKLGLQAPTTTDELYEVLKAFKEKDPNGNGKADEVPFAGATDGWRSNVESFIMNAFTFDAGMYNPLRTYLKNGEVATIVNTQEYKEGLIYLNKLYKEGLIYQPSFTQKSDQLKALANNPGDSILGAFPNGAHVGIIDVATNQPRYAEFTTLAPLKGPNGVQQVPFFEYDSAQTGDFLISSTSKHPEAAIRWADDMYSYETQQRVANGVKGEQWDDPDAGDVGLNGKPALMKRLRPYSNEPQNYGWMHAGLEYAPAEWRLGEATDPSVDPYSPQGLEKLLYEETDKKYKPFTPPKEQAAVLPPIKLLSEENTELQTIRVELENYITESRVRFIIGDLNFNSDWDSYLQSLENIGLGKLLEIYQKGYERQYQGK